MQTRHPLHHVTLTSRPAGALQIPPLPPPRTPRHVIYPIDALSNLVRSAFTSGFSDHDAAVFAIAR